MAEKELAVCDECGSLFFKGSSQMMGLCPECAHILSYISASIVMQLLAVAVPYFQKMQREGESGRKKIQWYTRVMMKLHQEQCRERK